MFELFVYTVWACLKGITRGKTTKEECIDKKYLNDNYNYYSESCIKTLRSTLVQFLTYMFVFF